MQQVQRGCRSWMFSDNLGADSATLAALRHLEVVASVIGSPSLDSDGEERKEGDENREEKKLNAKGASLFLLI